MSIAAQPRVEQTVEQTYWDGKKDVPCVSCEVIPQHTKPLRGIENFDILLGDHKRAKLLTLLVNHSAV